MLRAVVQHPAMLVYLDNWQSFGPDSMAGRRRNKGLNENLAREIMELHTLGVNGGYNQADVTSFARVLTGWTITPLRATEPGRFRFTPQVHEPGDKQVLGRRYPEGGQQEGDAVTARSRAPSGDRALHRHQAGASFHRRRSAAGRDRPAGAALPGKPTAISAR